MYHSLSAMCQWRSTTQFLYARRMSVVLWYGACHPSVRLSVLDSVACNDFSFSENYAFYCFLAHEESLTIDMQSSTY